MTFNSGNTFNVLSRAGVCGDPLKVCTQSKSGSLMTKGFSEEMTFKKKSSESIPANYFCLFNFTAMYDTDWSLSVSYD